MTNQHVASGQLQKVSTNEKDYTRDGFYAASREEELKCPDLEVNVLVSYEDVTSRVQAAVKPGASDKEDNEQRKAEIARIEKESTEKTKLRSEVVTLTAGANTGSIGIRSTRTSGSPSRSRSKPAFSAETMTTLLIRVTTSTLRSFVFTRTASPRRPSTSNGRPMARLTASSLCSREIQARRIVC
jgi:hypothetical protein